MSICGSRAIRPRQRHATLHTRLTSSSGIKSMAPRRPAACSFINTMSRIISSGSWVCTRNGKATFPEHVEVGEQRTARLFAHIE